jgi:hypothetical protein
VCPGQYLASNSIYIKYVLRSAFLICTALAHLGFSIARILWGFNLSKARDEDGKEIDVDTFAYTDGECWTFKIDTR